MTKKVFNEFIVVENEKAKEIVAQYDWGKQKEEWLGYLDKLYNKIKEILKEFIDEKKIVIKMAAMQIEEEYIGIYTVNRMEIIIGAKSITLTPIGTNLIAAKGRVDMKAKNGLMKILLVDPRMKGLRDHITITEGPDTKKEETSEKRNEIGWEWRLLTAAPSSQYMELNESNFMDAIMELSHD